MNQIPRTTPLGQRIHALGYQLHQVADGTRINRWRLNDYLHCHRLITAPDMVKLCAFLKCQPTFLQTPFELIGSDTGSKGPVH